MGKYKRTYKDICSGRKDKNIRFEDFLQLLKVMEFDCRIKGDHYIHSKVGVDEILNLQPEKKHGKTLSSETG